jgi:hypothetical protein
MGFLISIPHGNEAKNIGNKREVHSTHIKLMELRQADDGGRIHSSGFLNGRTRRSASVFVGREGREIERRTKLARNAGKAQLQEMK